MKWRGFLLAALVAAGSCARPRPALTPDQRAFTEVPLADSGVVENEDEMDVTIPAFDPLHGAGVADQIKARYRGNDRKDPKTSIAPGALQKFDNLPALIATLPSDDTMRHHNPIIERDTMSRAVEERRNVRVSVWIYAMKYEADQDFHVIIGTNPATDPKTFFNAEISGLPANSSAAQPKLSNVRKELAAIFADDLPSGSGYRKYSKPIAVVIEGSLFFDVDHDAGVVGPAGIQPKTAWEIHPVTQLTRK